MFELSLYNINTLTKIELKQIKKFSDFFFEEMFIFTYQDIEYVLDTNFTYDFLQWEFRDPFMFFKNDQKYTITKFKTEYSDCIALSNCIDISECVESYRIIDEVADNIKVGTDNYFDLLETNQKLEKAYELLESKYHNAAIIIKAAYIYDIRKLNIKKQYETFLFLYKNYSFILLNML